MKMMNEALDVIWPRYTLAIDPASNRREGATMDYFVAILWQKKRDGRMVALEMANGSNFDRIPHHLRNPMAKLWRDRFLCLLAGLAIGKLFAMMIRWTMP